MFQVYHSNQLNLLKNLIIEIIKKTPLNDPFVSEHILVQSNGIAKWLQIELAKSFNISANIMFLIPAKFIWDTLVKFFPNAPEENIFTQDKIIWIIMSRLPLFLHQKSFRSLRNYLFYDDHHKRKLYQVSLRIAELFEKYFIYRSDWLNHWESGKLIDGLGEAQKWQSILWKDFVEYTRSKENLIWHSGSLYNHLIKHLQNLKSIDVDLPQRVFIFGIASMPPIYFKVLEALGCYIDIHLLFLNPCRHYWGEIKDKSVSIFDLQTNSNLAYPILYNSKQNPSILSNFKKKLTNQLLFSWGKLGRDSLFLLAQRNSSVNDINYFIEPPQDNLLHRLQSNILNLNNNFIANQDQLKSQNHTKYQLDPTDRSITVHVCHNIQREIEVLHDYILARMEEDIDLHPRDIIVMVADIDNYSPFIQAVFTGVQDRNYLPFSISDYCTIKSYPVIQAFLNLLKLPDLRFTSEEILSLLEVPSLAQKFSVNEKELSLLRRWIIESGIRWGLNDDTMKELSLPTMMNQHTWNFGLKRMLLGYALESCHGSWQGILPYDKSNGLIAELIGNLSDLISRLETWSISLSKERSLKDWQSVCSQLINDFFVKDLDNEEELLIILTQWKKVIEKGVQGFYDQPISIKLIQEELYRNLDKQRINNSFLTGAINFCTLMPMRTIPFKIICLLGMNDSIYPRKLLPLGFDLMQQQIRKGDRNCRDDDRYSFLEALVSAQNIFYISYIRRSIKNNTECYPSIMVKELIDYIVQNFYLFEEKKYPRDITDEQRVREHIQIFHSRMPFEAENFQPGTYGQSFAIEWLPAVNGNGLVPLDFIQNLQVQNIEIISLEQLFNFWYHPVRAWFKQRLGINFSINNMNVPDSEPFINDNLEYYTINVQLLNALITEENIHQLYSNYRAAGRLPYGVFGDLFWQNQIEKMQEIASNIRNQYQKAQKWEINLRVGKIQLIGWLNHVQNDGLLKWQPHILNINDGLLFWLEHLIYCALGGRGESRIYGLKKSSWIFKSLEIHQAQFLLKKYINGYRSGLKQPLMLFNKSSNAWLKASFDWKSGQLLKDKKTKQRACNKLLKAWQGDFQNHGDSIDPYLRRICDEMNHNRIKSIIDATCKWYLPMILHASR